MIHLALSQCRCFVDFVFLGVRVRAKFVTMGRIAFEFRLQMYGFLVVHHFDWEDLIGKNDSLFQCVFFLEYNHSVY